MRSACYDSGVPLDDTALRLLWSRSGGRCAYCGRALTMEAGPQGDASGVGLACHIVSASEDGPRHDRFFPGESLDEPLNLLLLCPTHHRLVEESPLEYSVAALRLMKARHERRVEAEVEALVGRKGQPKLERLSSGGELLRLVLDAEGLDFSRDDAASTQGAELIAGLLELLEKWRALGQAMPAARQVQAGYQLTAELEALLRSGFVVYGGKSGRSAAIRVFKTTNPIVSR